MTKQCFGMWLLLVLATAGEASAQVPEDHGAGSALNPLDYDSLGAFPMAPGTYLFDTSGVPTLIGPGVRIEGIVVDLVAVFTFDEIWVPPAMVLNCLGSRPLALLSHRSVTVEGRISAGACGSEYGCSLGCGGDSPFPSGPGGGGGFGGAGYGWGPNEGGYGGASHGDILVALQGGSSGGAGADFLGSPSYGGGFGGGALELGAVDTITIRGPGIYADGGHGYQSGPYVFCTGEEYTGGGGGGSGGGILVHANSVALETRLSARGGYGGSGCGGPGGGGGGGGRIAVTVGSGRFLNTGTVDVAGRWGQVGQIVLPRPGPPTSEFSSSCQFLVCTFTDASTPGTVAIASLSWNFGDGSPTGTASSATHTFSSAGSYTVTLTATDLNGLMDSSSKVVVVAAPLPPTAALTVSCTNLSCDFADASTAGSGAIALRSWSFGDGTPAVNAMAGSHTFARAGTYVIAVAVTDVNGLSSSAGKTVTVAALSNRLHVGYSGITTKWTSPSGKTNYWSATVTVLLHDTAEHPIAGATLTAAWTGAVVTTVTCVAYATGKCVLKSGTLSDGRSWVTLNVTAVVAPGSTVYDPTANHNQSGTRTTTITMNRP